MRVVRLVKGTLQGSRILAVAAVLATFMTSQSHAQPPAFNPPFPRLGHAQIGTARPFDQERLEEIARLDVVVVPGWRTFKTSDGYDIESFPAALKALNPDIKVFPYTNPPDMHHTNSTWSFPRNKIESERSLNGRYSDWWLRTASGAKITAATEARDRLNMTPAVTRDSSGLIWPEWFARYLNAAPTDTGDWVQASGKGYKQGAWDGVFVDNVWVTRYYGVTADWDDDGLDEDYRDDTVQNLVVDGHIAYVNEWRKLQPERYVIANLSSLVDKNSQPLHPRMYGIYDGGILEWINQAEDWGGWSQMMADYRLGMEMSNAPKIVIFPHNLPLTRKRYPESTFSDYRWNRYFMASCLMDDGYYVTSTGTTGFLWFDEFDIELGYPVDKPQYSAWSKGIYKREFENGLVLVNPKGNGIQTVEIGSGWKRFLGNQDSEHNDGKVVTEITLEAQDGIILVRDGTARPEAVQEIAVE